MYKSSNAFKQNVGKIIDYYYVDKNIRKFDCSIFGFMLILGFFSSLFVTFFYEIQSHTFDEEMFAPSVFSTHRSHSVSLSLAFRRQSNKQHICNQFYFGFKQMRKHACIEMPCGCSSSSFASCKSKQLPYLKVSMHKCWQSTRWIVYKSPKSMDFNWRCISQYWSIFFSTQF